MDLGRIVVSQFAIIRIILEATQSAFTCSKLTIETLKQGVKYVQS